MKKYYLKIIIANLIPVILTFLPLMYGLVIGYEGEYTLFAVFIVFWLSFCNFLFLSALSITIFLNLSEKIKENEGLSFLSWFLLPCIGIVVWFVYILKTEMWPMLLLNSLPTFAGLVFSYRRFRLDNKKVQRTENLCSTIDNQ
ncbi:MAG: hypothetical protein LBN27_07665 [Prevotellaceae bacterium]|nr:hypothetical protein [Prevotellaceae bacterium]